MFVHGIKPGSSEEEEEDVMDILMVCLTETIYPKCCQSNS